MKDDGSWSGVEVEFEALAPAVFALLRTAVGVTQEEFLAVL